MYGSKQLRLIFLKARIMPTGVRLSLKTEVLQGYPIYCEEFSIPYGTLIQLQRLFLQLWSCYVSGNPSS